MEKCRTTAGRCRKKSAIYLCLLCIIWSCGCCAAGMQFHRALWWMRHATAATLHATNCVTTSQERSFVALSHSARCCLVDHLFTIVFATVQQQTVIHTTLLSFQPALLLPLCIIVFYVFHASSLTHCCSMRTSGVAIFVAAATWLRGEVTCNTV